MSDLVEKDKLRRELSTLNVALALVDNLAKNVELDELQRHQRSLITGRIDDIEKALQD